MKFDLSKIQYSWKDVKDNVKIPKELTPELAEFIGIMVGDGHIEDRKRKDRNFENVYEMSITGNIIDSEYYYNYLNTLIKGLFNIPFCIKLQKSRNAIIVFKNSKAIHSFIKKITKIPSRKDDIKTPKIIMNGSKSIKAAYLR